MRYSLQISSLNRLGKNRLNHYPDFLCYLTLTLLAIRLLGLLFGMWKLNGTQRQPMRSKTNTPNMDPTGECCTISRRMWKRLFLTTCVAHEHAGCMRCLDKVFCRIPESACVCKDSLYVKISRSMHDSDSSKCFTHTHAHSLAVCSKRQEECIAKGGRDIHSSRGQIRSH